VHGHGRASALRRTDESTWWASARRAKVRGTSLSELLLGRSAKTGGVASHSWRTPRKWWATLRPPSSKRRARLGYLLLLLRRASCGKRTRKWRL
jgi:hypothetical protein